jgi:BspA type Leucine rich repeat region (6 copies)
MSIHLHNQFRWFDSQHYRLLWTARCRDHSRHDKRTNGNGNLTSVTIPTSVTNIAAEAFENSSITSLSIFGNANIGEEAFQECTQLGTVYVAGGVIGIEAFQLCSVDSNGPGLPSTPVSGLTNVTFGSNVMSIGEEAFLSDVCISNIIFPSSITSIDDSAFAGCSLTNAVFSYGITNIGDYAFVQNDLTSILLPGSLMSIGDQAFYDNGSLTNLTMGAGVASITAGAFEENFKLTTVFIQGNAPAVVGLPGDGPVFLDTSATVYYLPDTTGWSNTYGWNNGTWGFSGAPTALWNPAIAPAMLHNGQFGVTVTGNTNIPIQLQACTNLCNPSWTPLTNASLTNGSFYYSEPVQSNCPARFYRVVFP